MSETTMTHYDFVQRTHDLLERLLQGATVTSSEVLLLQSFTDAWLKARPTSTVAPMYLPGIEPELPERARARATDPSTSLDAAKSITASTLRHQQHLVLTTIDTFANAGRDAIDEEIIQRLGRCGLQMTDSGCRTRRSELKQAGLVRECARRRNSRGRLCMAHTITDAGKAVLARYKADPELLAKIGGGRERTR